MISIIIPVYNNETYISKCVDSLLKQTFQNFEVILINDGSTDNSLQILQDIDFGDIKTTILTQENQGQAVARNAGVRVCSGEFICFIDIDDYIEDTMLEKLYQKQQERNADIVWCDANMVVKDSVVGKLSDTSIHADAMRSAYILNNAGPCRKLIRTSLVKKNALYFPDIRFYEDVAVVPAYGLFAERIDYVDQPLYNYVMHTGSTMHQPKYDKRLENIFDSIQYLQGLFEKSKQTEEDRTCLEYIVIDHLLHSASLRFFAFPGEKKSLIKICAVMRTNYPNWSKNKYYKSQTWKYRLVCQLFYRQRYRLLKLLLK